MFAVRWRREKMFGKKFARSCEQTIASVACDVSLIFFSLKNKLTDQIRMIHGRIKIHITEINIDRRKIRIQTENQ